MGTLISFAGRSAHDLELAYSPPRDQVDEPGEEHPADLAAVQRLEELVADLGEGGVGCVGSIVHLRTKRLDRAHDVILVEAGSQGRIRRKEILLLVEVVVGLLAPVKCKTMHRVVEVRGIRNNPNKLVEEMTSNPAHGTDGETNSHAAQLANLVHKEILDVRIEAADVAPPVRIDRQGATSRNVLHSHRLDRNIGIVSCTTKPGRVAIGDVDEVHDLRSGSSPELGDEVVDRHESLAGRSPMHPHRSGDAAHEIVAVGVTAFH